MYWEVNAADLEREGAVSEAVVLQMAEGVRKITGADYAVSTSGVAGPGRWHAGETGRDGLDRSSDTPEELCKIVHFFVYPRKEYSEGSL